MPTLYALSSSDQPDVFRYVGCTQTAPALRLANHASALTLVGSWIHWTRLSGAQILMHFVQDVPDDLSRQTELSLIRRLTGQHLFNRESWQPSQLAAGVPKHVLRVHRDLLVNATSHFRRGEYHHACTMLHLMKTLQRDFSSMNLILRHHRLATARALSSEVTTSGVIGTLEAIASDYQGHTLDAIRLNLTAG